MEVSDLVRASLDRVKTAYMRTIDGLSYAELKWQPKPGANSIGLILFHAVRSEDSFVQTRIQGKPQIWESGKWYQKLNLPQEGTGSGYTAEQVDAFPVPQLTDWMAYAEAVCNSTLDYLKKMRPDNFDKVINTPRLGDITIGAVFALVIVHLAQHAGEISYLRGLQRGLNK